MASLLRLVIELDGDETARTKLGRFDKRMRGYRQGRAELAADAELVITTLKQFAPVAESRPGREEVGGLMRSIHSSAPTESYDGLSVEIMALGRARFTRPPGIAPHFVPVEGENRELNAGDTPIAFYWQKVGEWVFASQVYSGSIGGGYHPDSDWVEDAMQDVLPQLRETFMESVASEFDNA